VIKYLFALNFFFLCVEAVKSNISQRSIAHNEIADNKIAEDSIIHQKNAWFRQIFKKNQNWDKTNSVLCYCLAKLIHLFCYVFAIALPYEDLQDEALEDEDLDYEYFDDEDQMMQRNDTHSAQNKNNESGDLSSAKDLSGNDNQEDPKIAEPLNVIKQEEGNRQAAFNVIENLCAFLKTNKFHNILKFITSGDILLSRNYSKSTGEENKFASPSAFLSAIVNGYQIFSSDKFLGSFFDPEIGAFSIKSDYYDLKCSDSFSQTMNKVAIKQYLTHELNWEIILKGVKTRAFDVFKNDKNFLESIVDQIKNLPPRTILQKFLHFLTNVPSADQSKILKNLRPWFKLINNFVLSYNEKGKPEYLYLHDPASKVIDIKQCMAELTEVQIKDKEAFENCEKLLNEFYDQEFCKYIFQQLEIEPISAIRDDQENNRKLILTMFFKEKYIKLTFEDEICMIKSYFNIPQEPDKEIFECIKKFTPRDNTPSDQDKRKVQSVSDIIQKRFEGKNDKARTQQDLLKSVSLWMYAELKQKKEDAGTAWSPEQSLQAIFDITQTLLKNLAITQTLLKDLE